MSTGDARSSGRGRPGGDGLAGELRHLAVDLAEEAGQLALAARRSGGAGRRSGLRTKSSGTDLATDADRAAEQLIRSRLAATRPDDGVLGEEGGESPGSSSLVWLIDPIDGTTNFVYDFPAWAVSVAVAERAGPDGPPRPAPLAALLGGAGRLLAGAVHAPVAGETFAASLGGGATHDGRRLRVDPGPLELGQALVATGFGYASSARRAQAGLLAHVLPAVRDIRRAGAASLDLCSVAAGRVDGYYEAGLNPWDLAAGLLIAVEAGAASRAIEGLPPGGPTLVVSRPGLAEPLAGLLAAAAAAADAHAAAGHNGR